MDTYCYQEMMDKIRETSKDIRMIGLWFLFGEKVELCSDSSEEKHDKEMFEQLLIHDPAAAPLFRELSDYSPCAQHIHFYYSETKPAAADQINPLRDQKTFAVEGSEYSFLLTKEADRTTKIVFWK